MYFLKYKEQGARFSAPALYSQAQDTTGENILRLQKSMASLKPFIGRLTPYTVSYKY